MGDCRDVPDGALARRIAAAGAAGAAAEEAEVYRRFAPRVRLHAQRRLRDRDESADHAHEVLVITLIALRAGTVREPDQLASFVLGTSRSLLIDRARTAARRRELLARFPTELADRVEPAPALDRDRLAHCLEQLDDRARSVLVLSFWLECSAEEAARDLGTTAGNVRVLRHRALARLSDCIGQEGA
ncbi:MAG TPA: sigma-70 family RNA polymerase sigma factor [Kofleriaceae bacterium]|nr:sigma-70 family RNA polymerase sigma factor [Kofleriaceae bacterium]